MGQKFRNLMPLIVEPENLREAYRRARKNKRMSAGHLHFKEYSEANLANMAASLMAGEYIVPPYHIFTVHEPKAREIMALQFYDRVIQHALCNIVEPIFDAVLMPMSAACRKDKGTHYGLNRAQSHMRQLAVNGPVYCLKMDFSKYFANIDRASLHREIRRKISCKKTLELIESITPVTGRGLPIGNLTSQLWANVYGHLFDRFLVHKCNVRHATRYMDDTVVFGNDLTALQSLKAKIDHFLANEMNLSFSKWSIQPISRGVNFLGFRIWTNRRLLRTDTVKRARRKLRWLRDQNDAEGLQRFTAAWTGHAGHGSTFNLLKSLGLQALATKT